MITQRQIKEIISLRQSKVRRELKLFFAEGYKLNRDLILNGFSPVMLFADKNWAEKHKSDTAFFNGLELVSESEMSRISALNTPSPFLGVFKMPNNLITSLNFNDRLIAALDDISDPGNMGTIIRTADWFGIRDLVCSPNCVDVYNPKVVQATMGSIARVKVTTLDLTDWLSSVKVPVYGTLLDGENLYKMNLSNTGIIVIGNESRGINPELFPYITNRLRIPEGPHGTQAESLNASVAAAIVFAEFSRRSQQ
ncbi:MAG: RNA methyltransferase [Sphingobacteriia bacterium]|nr:RNA methyltransferase [Sphingobacteriia bacterium]